MFFIKSLFEGTSQEVRDLERQALVVRRRERLGIILTTIMIPQITLLIEDTGKCQMCMY